MEAIIKGAITAAVFLYIAYSMKRDAVPGKLFLSSWILWLGIVCTGFVTLMVYVVATGQVRAEFSQYLAIALLILFFGAASAASFLEYYFTRGSYDQEGIRHCTPWRGCKECPWEDISSITHNDSMHWYLFHCHNGVVLRFSDYLTGIDDLMHLAEKKMRHRAPKKEV